MYKTLGFLGIACFLVLLIAAGCSTTTSTTTTTTLPITNYTITGVVNQGIGTYETAVVVLSLDPPGSGMQFVNASMMVGTFEGSSPASFPYALSYSTNEAHPREYYVFSMSPEDWEGPGPPPYMASSFITLESNSLVSVDAITLQ
jgi:hypothetical protein